MKGNTIGLIGHKNKGMKLNLSDEQRKNRSKKRVEYLANNKNIKASTSIELKFMKFLTDNNIEYIHQYPVHTDNGSWLYDFYIASMQLFVELDGEFWHSTKQSIRRDKIKNKIAKSVSIVLARISSDDMNFDIIFDDNDTIWNANYNLISIREMKYE
jgi:very-short-patch-repair endonuclease